MASKKEVKDKVGTSVTTKTQSPVAAKKEVKHKVGTPVTYVPNGVDFGSRPKNVSVPATIINVSEKEITLRDTCKLGEKGAKVTRTIVNLIVLQDTDVCNVRKVNVVHKNEALEGESFFE